MKIENKEQIKDLDFEKVGLMPAIVQDADTGQVLMQGYQNTEAVAQSVESGKVCFYSRSKERLWTKGEESGNFLNIKEIYTDCDKDSILYIAEPVGPTCHKGTSSCFNTNEGIPVAFLSELSQVIEQRKSADEDSSYTASLFKKGINKVAQKFGEESVELLIEAKDNNEDLFLNEAADLLYHYMVLLSAKGYSLTEVVKVLKSRAR